MKKLAATYCSCGAVSIHDAWKMPTATLAVFLKTLTVRGFTEIVFVKMTCPDCFEGRKMGEYALKEEAPALDFRTIADHHSSHSLPLSYS